MKIVFTDMFRRDYRDLPDHVQRALDKALKFLLGNSRHPSVRVKKLPGTEVWYGRATRAYRFTLQLNGDTCLLRRAGTHAILNSERRRS